MGIISFYKILQNGALRTAMEPPHGRGPRASLIVIAGTLSMFHIPEAGLLLLLGIDLWGAAHPMCSATALPPHWSAVEKKPYENQLTALHDVQLIE